VDGTLKWMFTPLTPSLLTPIFAIFARPGWAGCITGSGRAVDDGAYQRPVIAKGGRTCPRMSGRTGGNR
jgi:hypothetical protein